MRKIIIGQKIKVSFAILLPIILICSLLFAFAFFRIRIFYGDKTDALNTLNGVVQSLSAIVAIVFSIIIVVVQTTLGRHVTRAVWYVISDWVNILMLFLYVCTITSALWTMWGISSANWTLGMDVTMTVSIVCLGALLPFFFRMSQSLNPAPIMNQVKNEILDAYRKKDFKLTSDKTNLLFSMIKRSIDVGDVEYAFEGVKLVEEVVKLEDVQENRWVFLNLIQALLDNLGMESLPKNPNVTLRIFDVYTSIGEKTKNVPPIFVNVSERIVQSVVEICREGLPTRFANALLLKASHMIIDIYKFYVLLDYYFVCLTSLDSRLVETLKMSREIGALDTFPIAFAMDHAVMELLKKGKNEEALHMSEVIFGQTTASPFVKMSLIGLVMNSKAEGFDDFASKSLQIVKKKFAPFKIGLVHDPNFGDGRTETSVKPDGSMEVKTGDEKKEKASLWMNQEMGNMS